MAEITFKISDITVTGIGDVDLNEVGQPKMLEGRDKLVQDILEILLVFQGERDVPRTMPEYGSKIMDVMGYPMGVSGVTTLLRGAVNDAMKKLKALQRDKLLEDDEKLSKVVLVQVEEDNSRGALGWRFFLAVETYNKEQLNLEGLFVG
jgi:phage baseplate assembly protein W